MPYKDQEVAKARARKRYLENKETIIARSAAWAKANPERVAELNRAWVKANPEKRRASVKKYDSRIPDEVKAAKAAAWRKANPDKALASRRRCESNRQRPPRTEEQQTRANALRLTRRRANLEAEREKAAGYRAANRDKYNSSAQKRRARERLPLWDTELTELTVTEAYLLARSRGLITGTKWEVDHVVPLFGRLVSGFHTWSNLRVVQATTNRRKSNLFQPT